MKQFKQIALSLLAIFSLFITSCSDDDTVVETGDITIGNSVDFGRIALGNSKEITVEFDIATTTIDTIDFTLEGEGFTSDKDFLLPTDQSITLTFGTDSDNTFGDYTGTLSVTLGAEVTEVSLVAEVFSGFYVVNEGGFGNGNTSISFYDRETEEMINDLFITANGTPLGDQAQSISIHNGSAYIAVQNSGKLEVVNLDDFTSIATIDDAIESPRYFVGVSDTKGYVSDWGSDGVSGTVRVIDLTTNSVSSTINIGRQGPNRMLLIGNELFVANNGGFGRDSNITVIDTTTDQVTRTIQVADNPDGMVVDSNGDIWVACRGHVDFDPNTFEVIPETSTPAAIVKINTAGAILSRLDYTDVGFGFSASNININAAGNEIYYLYSSNAYKLSTSSSTLPANSFLPDFYYGLSVDPKTDDVIAFEAPSFSSSGNAYFYDVNGELQKTLVVGIGPNGATFN
ncbi:MAG: hypothetical protein HRT61_17260 [Ekhidna sp.]|nr:hypothetical protein [Ekhidna sp.]